MLHLSRRISQLQASDHAALQSNSAQTMSSFVEFGRDKTRQTPPSAAIRREQQPLQNIGPSHNCWNCWNSIAVMFELRCSEFELFCSESASQPRDQGGRRFKSSLRSILWVIPLVSICSLCLTGHLIARFEE